MSRNKSLLGRHDLEVAKLKGIGNCLYVKKDKDGRRTENYSPTLYAKVTFNSKNDEFYTKFLKGKVQKGEDTELNPKEIIGKRCNLIAATCFESLYVSGSNISLQAKADQIALTPVSSWSREQVVPIKVVSDEEDYY